MHEKIRKSLKAKIFLIMFFSNLAVILLVGAFSYYSKKAALNDEIKANLSIMASELADKVGRYLNQRQADTRAIALHYSLYGLKSTTSNQNDILAKYLKIYPFYEHINIINVEDLKLPIKSSFSVHEPWYMPALRGNIVSSDVYVSPFTGKPTMSFAAPVMNEKGHVISVITTNLKMGQLWELLDQVQQENSEKGQTGSAFIVNKEGYFIAHPDKDKILNEMPMELPDRGLKKMVSAMVEGGSGTTTFDYENIRKMAAYAPCNGFGDYKGHGWSIAVTENYSDISASLKRLLHVYLIIFLLTSLAVLVITRKLANYLVGPILALQGGATKIGAGNFGMRIRTVAEDEIGDLAKSFNSMAEALESRDAKIREYTDNLKAINNELAAKQEELSQANTFLKKTNEEIVRLEKQKDEFLAMITHDIKSPLSTVLTYCEMILDDTITGEDDTNKAITSIHASGHKILTLVENYLVSTAIEAGKFHLKKEALDLNEFLDDGLPFFLPQFEKKKIKFAFEKREGLPAVSADKVQLDRAFSNLISNAIKFSPSGARITVSTGLSEYGVSISISDNAGGIEEAELKSLFDKYQRSKNTGRIEGMGLGLFIAKAIVEAHGGKLTVVSKVGYGSTFSIHIPTIITAAETVG